MESKRFGSKVLMRLDPGEELVASVQAVCEKHGVKLASVSGIGAVNRATVGLFKVETKEYVKDELTGDFEIAALMGNVSTMNGETYLHLHVTLADVTHAAVGGHLNEAWVSATAEIILDVMEGEIDREFSETVGLNLVRF